MKAFKLISFCGCLFMLLCSINLAGQSCTYENMYDNPADWTLVHEGENLPDVPQHPGPGEILVVNNRVEMYNFSGGGHDKRIYRTIPALSDTWAVEFETRIIDANPNFSGGAFWHTLLALTAGNEIPLTKLVYPFDYDNPQFVDSEQDGIVVELTSTGASTSLRVMTNDNGAILEACSIVLPLNLAQRLPKTGKIMVENFGDGTGKLSLELSGGTPIGECCFNIPETIGNLTHIQHGNSPLPGYARYMTGGIGNLCITDGATLSSACNGGLEISSTTSDDDFSLTLFPNPVTDILTIRISDSGEADADLNISILDLQGRLVMQKSYPRTETLEQSIDVSGLSVGSYAMVVQLSDGQFHARKIFIKQ